MLSVKSPVHLILWSLNILNPPSAKFSLKSKESHQLSVILGIKVTRSGHIKRKDLEIAL